MKELSLRPYPGTILLCESPEEMRKAYRKLTKTAYPYKDDPEGGRFIRLECAKEADTAWIVFAATAHALAHEYSHVLLHLFRIIGHDPREGDGEAFCYMLSQLMLESN